jgi:CHASE1-domain containing sensor protein
VQTYSENIALHSTRSTWWRDRYVWLSLVVAIAGLIVSATAWFAVSHRDNQLAALALSSRAEGHALSLQVGLIPYLRKVSGLAALFESSDDTVSRAQFERFTKLVMSDQTAILGMSWIPRVTREQRVAHERAAALDGIPDYNIKVATQPPPGIGLFVINISRPSPGLMIKFTTCPFAISARISSRNR